MKMLEVKKYLESLSLEVKKDKSNQSESRYLEINMLSDDEVTEDFVIRYSNHKRSAYLVNNYYEDHEYEFDLKRGEELKKGEILEKLENFMFMKNISNNYNKIKKLLDKEIKENWNSRLRFWMN